jgi:hypothetical protein
MGIWFSVRLLQWSREAEAVPGTPKNEGSIVQGGVRCQVKTGAMGDARGLGRSLSKRDSADE